MDDGESPPELQTVREAENDSLLLIVDYLRLDCVLKYPTLL